MMTGSGTGLLAGRCRRSASACRPARRPVPPVSMELYSLQVFLTVATERSFSRAAEKLLRTQPAVSLAIQRLELELGEKLIDRSGKELILTDAGRTVLHFAPRLETPPPERQYPPSQTPQHPRGPPRHRPQQTPHPLSAPHIERYRELYPKIK